MNTYEGYTASHDQTGHIANCVHVDLLVWTRSFRVWGFYRDKVGDYGYGHLRESSVTGLGGTGRLEASFRIKSRRHGVRQSSFTVFDACMAYISEHHLLRTPLQKLRKATSATIIGGFIAAFDHGPSVMLG